MPARLPQTLGNPRRRPFGPAAERDLAICGVELGSRGASCLARQKRMIRARRSSFFAFLPFERAGSAWWRVRRPGCFLWSSAFNRRAGTILVRFHLKMAPPWLVLVGGADARDYLRWTQGRGDESGLNSGLAWGCWGFGDSNKSIDRARRAHPADDPQLMLLFLTRLFFAFPDGGFS